MYFVDLVEHRVYIVNDNNVNAIRDYLFYLV